MMKRFFLTLMVSAFLLLPFSVGAVDLEKSFETSFGLVNSTTNIYLMNSYDNNENVDGYIIYNSDFLIKYDLNNKVVLSKKNISPSDLEVTSNGNLLIKRIDENTGDILWQSEYGGNGYEVLYDTFNSYGNDGKIDGYFIYFKLASTDLEIQPGCYIMKYDLNGKLVWIKPFNDYFSHSIYATDENGDLLSYSSDMSFGAFYCVIKNVSQNTNVNMIDAGGYWGPTFLIDKLSSDKLIIIFNDHSNDILHFGKYTLTGQKLSTKSLNISNQNLFTIPIDSITINGEYDGFIVGNSGDYGNCLLNFDYDGNLLWKKTLSYNPEAVIESYDEIGNFNGYIVVGYDSDNKGYITKFTYPKKVIESKNNDVEVLDYTYPGKVVTLKPKEKAGYFVKRVIVRDSSGKEIEVSNDNTFVMPDDDVSIEVIYEKRETEPAINPDTASTISVILVLVSIVVFGTVLIRVTVLNKSM